MMSYEDYTFDLTETIEKQRQTELERILRSHDRHEIDAAQRELDALDAVQDVLIQEVGA